MTHLAEMPRAKIKEWVWQKTPHLRYPKISLQTDQGLDVIYFQFETVSITLPCRWRKNKREVKHSNIEK